MWRRLRIAVLLFVLLLVGSTALLDRFNAANWDDTLTVGIFPIDADGRPATRLYLDKLNASRFTPLEDFFAREAARYGVTEPTPVRVRLQAAGAERPPQLSPNSNAIARLWWSLKLRWYARRQAQGRAGQVRVFVLYHDPEVTPRVPHSLGLQKGLVGVVYAYATRAADATNNVVIAHEILHTLGATDKYDPESLQPVFPQGFADPQRDPRLPQSQTELMAGRRPISEREAEMPTSLDETVIGPDSAREIFWPVLPP